jgi:hypothetical protein
VEDLLGAEVLTIAVLSFQRGLARDRGVGQLTGG